MGVEGLGPLGWRERVGGFGGVWVGARGGLVFFLREEVQHVLRVLLSPKSSLLLCSLSLSLCAYAV